MLNGKEFLNDRFGKESQSIFNDVSYAICEKLSELGVENIYVFSDYINFLWCNRLCTYKNDTIECGTEGVVLIDDILNLDTNALDCLVGKLTDEQLNRVGILIDLFENKYSQLFSQREDMKSVGMEGTKLYLKNKQALLATLKTLMKLNKVFQIGFVDRTIKRDFLCYILDGV